MKIGTLYGVGVGPGAPDLITVKAVKILNEVEVIFAAASDKNEYSLALEIARSHLNNGAEVVRLDFPMTREAEKLNRAWLENSQRILEYLKRGTDVAFITLGDPLTYSTFGYLLRTIRAMAPEIPIETVPGITSYQAAAAAAGEVMAEQEEVFCVVSGAKGGERLKDVINHADSVVLLKVYHHLDEILDTVSELGLRNRATLVSRCGMADQVVCRNPQTLRGDKVPYLSLLIVRKGG